MSTPATLSDRPTEAIQEDADVGFAYLFGSAGKGRLRSASDLDVAVSFDAGNRKMSRGETAERALDLEGRLEARLGRPVQAVALDHVPPELIQNALGHGRPLEDGQ